VTGPEEAIDLLDRLDAAGMWNCGWGVGALLGEQTRTHDELASRPGFVAEKRPPIP